jgi:hypothetical protein
LQSIKDVTTAYRLVAYWLGHPAADDPPDGDNLLPVTVRDRHSALVLYPSAEQNVKNLRITLDGLLNMLVTI